MIADIADILANAGLQLTARELEDILWLASRIDEPTASDRPIAQSEPASDDQNIDNLGDALDEGSPRPEQSALPTAPGRVEPTLALYAKDMQGSVSGSTLRVRGPSQAPAPAALRRALQPFGRRIPSRWKTRLDEEETVTRTVDTGVWMPIFRPVRERRFHLTLVIEDCTSAELREETLRDLSKHFSYYSGLREVRCYRLHGDTPPRLVALDGETEYGFEHLKDNHSDDGRHLVLFATDGTSARWRNGSAQAFLHTVGASTCVSLLHLLPRAAWRRTLIGEPDVILHCERAGTPNTRFQTRLPWWMDANETQDTLPVPVLGLDAASAGTWARAISALGGATMPGVLVHRPAAPIPSALPAAAAPDPVKLVARYRNMVSTPAYRLAIFLSRANPTTLSIMRVVQRTMLPDSGDGELAEFLLGGLVARGERQEGHVERLYRFRDGVAGELLKALRFSEEETIVRQLSLVGHALEAEDDEIRDLEVAFPAPAGAPSLSEWALPFATVSRQILRGHAQLAMKLGDEVSIANRQEVPQAARTTLRILHLSDLHYGGPPVVARPDKVPPFGAAWDQHLRHLSASGGVDMVCVSGDLTWTAGPSEFARLEHLLDKTLEALGLPKSRLFVVPGNHDMQRDPALRRSAALGLSTNGTNETAVARAQSTYRTWLKGYLPHQSAATGDRYADFQLNLPGWVVPVRVVGIDSAWMTSIAAGAVLSAEQLQALETGAPTGVTLAMMHHLPQQLRAPRDVREHLVRARVDLLLHGAGHERGPTLTMFGVSDLVSSGVALSTQRDQPLAFHVIDVALDAAKPPELTEVTVHEWLKDASQWVARPATRLHAKTQAQPHSAPSTTELTPQHIFVGREAELEHLREILSPSRMRSGKPPRLMISGAPGAGKTTLFRRFAREYWPDGSDREHDYVVLNAGSGTDFEDQLLKKLGLTSKKTLYARLRRRHTLLVIDDVDSPDQMDAAHRFALSLPVCPALLIGRFPLVGAAESIDWKVITLGPLSAAESARLLSLLLDTTNQTIAESDAKAIVTALDGSPSLVRLLAGHLAEPASVARLLVWLGATHAIELPPRPGQEVVDDFPWLQRALRPVFENRWRTQLDEDVLEVLSTLAYGPSSGFSTSLGLALSDFARRTASAETIRNFTDICDRAVASGLLRENGPFWRFVAPAYVAWLRARRPKQRTPAIRRWSDWLAIRMAAPAKSRARPWAELNEIPAALIEWLETCPPEDAELVRPVCMPYAAAYGPLEAWQHLCRRTLQAYPADHPASADWYFTLAELAHANGEFDIALDAVDHYLALKSRNAKPDTVRRVVINAGITLRHRILANQEGRKIPGQPRSRIIETVPEEAQAPELRHHQQALVDAALAATLYAEQGLRCIGLVIQTQGTGATATLAAYVEACQHSGLLASSNVVVVAGRNDIAKQLVHALRSRGPGLAVTEPQSISELASLFRTERTPVVVTTEQKLQQLPGSYTGDRLIVGFALRRPSRALLTSFPKARMIVFGNESLTFKSSLAPRLGPLIASYRLADAIRDGDLAPPKIRRYPLMRIFWEGDKADRRAGDLSKAGINIVIAHIRKDWFARETSLPDKRILIVKNEEDAEHLAETLSSDMTSFDTRIMVLTASLQSRRAALDEFRRSTANALLITTAAMTVGLPLVGIDVCYVAAPLTPAILLKIESFVNRPAPERKIGEILDFANNDWEVLGLPM